MAPRRDGERGQALVEFALVVSLFFILLLGLVDVGRGFFDYTALSAAARTGARFGAVVGGTCLSQGASSTGDWCDQQGGTTISYWSQYGNYPLQGLNIACPKTYDSSPSFSGYYYSLSDSRFSGPSATTVMGSLVHHFDTGNTTYSFVGVSWTPGLAANSLQACIQIYAVSATPSTGDQLTVVVYYPFNPGVSPMGYLSQPPFNIQASSTYEIE
jgi:Flp pilus assembly protein TadG